MLIDTENYVRVASELAPVYVDAAVRLVAESGKCGRHENWGKLEPCISCDLPLILKFFFSFLKIIMPNFQSKFGLEMFFLSIPHTCFIVMMIYYGNASLI